MFLNRLFESIEVIIQLPVLFIGPAQNIFGARNKFIFPNPYQHLQASKAYQVLSVHPEPIKV